MKNLETWVKFDQVTINHGVFEMSPVERGMGLTIGNALRRVLLSSTKGVAPINIEIEGITHEFDSLDHIQEDVLDIIFNIKQVVFDNYDGEPIREITLDVSGKKDIKASDLNIPSDLKIINPDQHIATITDKKGSMKFKLEVELNIGYRPSENQNTKSKSISTIFLDSSFSPIERINHKVEDTRIGQDLNYDKLMVEVWCNGSISAEDAIKSASSILMDRLSLFGELNRKPVFEDVNQEEAQEASSNQNELFELSVDDLELSARSLNCLKKASIKTVGELIEKDMNDLYNIKNFGKKSADEINAKLSEYGLSLKVAEVI